MNFVVDESVERQIVERLRNKSVSRTAFFCFFLLPSSVVRSFLLPRSFGFTRQPVTFLFGPENKD
jgi:hypothetical protein